jgi:mannose-6-phosphate isomerase-like protein (cupin superfamily)
MNIVSISTAEHYLWGETCDGWHLVKRDEVGIIQERVPAGKTEVMHHHKYARQFFYVLEVECCMAFEDRIVKLQKGDGIEIPPLINHRFENRSSEDVHFLVISMPKTQGDRVNVD